jgi:hypothetical protein
MSSEKMFSSQTHDWRKLGRALGALAPGVEIQRKAQALTWQLQEEVEARGRRKTELVECWAPCAGYPLAVNPEVNQWEPASGHRVRAQGERKIGQRLTGDCCRGDTKICWPEVHYDSMCQRQKKNNRESRDEQESDPKTKGKKKRNRQLSSEIKWAHAKRNTNSKDTATRTDSWDATRGHEQHNQMKNDFSIQTQDKITTLIHRGHHSPYLI